VAVIPNGFGQVNLKFGGAGWPNKGEVTFGIERPSATAPEDMADIVQSWWDTYLKVRTPTSITLESILVKWGPNSTGAFAEVGYGTVGDGSVEDVPPNVAMLIQKVTGSGGRANRGRMYYPVAEDQIAGGGALESAEVTAGNTAFNNFRSALEAADAPLVILHATGVAAPTPVLSLVVQSVTATQRRRLRRS
jgi:hypothetical protein